MSSGDPLLALVARRGGHTAEPPGPSVPSAYSKYPSVDALSGVS